MNRVDRGSSTVQTASQRRIGWRGLARLGALAATASWALGGEAKPPVGTVVDGREFDLFPLFETAHQPDGRYRTWVLGLFHRTTNPDGSTWSYHVLPWVSSPHLTAVLPIYWRFGDAGAKHTYLAPAWFQGPGYTVVPPALTATWRRTGGRRALWVTPLFHANTRADGALDDLHALTWFHGDHHDVVLPVLYAIGEPGHRHVGVVPAWFSGPGWWTVPLALSVGWKRSTGGSSTWITPLAHVERDRTGAITSGHLLNWFHGRDYDLVFPLAWRSGAPGARHGGVLPFFAAGPGYWAAPLALTADWTHRDGGHSTWVTPLAHWRSDRDGEVLHAHVGPYVRGRDWQAVVPIAYLAGRPGQRHLGVLPLFAAGPDYWAVPAALSGAWKDGSGRRSTWVTPLFHVSTAGDGAVRSLHALTYLRGRDWHVAFPVAYAVGKPGQRHVGVVPFFATGRDYWTVPAALSGGWKDGSGGRTTWVTPLFHVSHDGDGAVRSLHALTYLRGRDWHVAFPVAYVVGTLGQRHVGVVPFFATGRDYWTVPAALSGGWKDGSGGRTTWVTPLFHVSHDGDGAVRSLHALTYVRGRDWHVAFPVVYVVGKPGQRHVGMVPFFTTGPDYWTVPAALTASWTHRGGGRTTWVTPLFHVRTDGDGTVRSLHALTYVRGRDWHVAFPVAYVVGKPGQRHVGVVPFFATGPDYWTVPAALTARWKNGSGGRTTWITPLLHVSTDGDGTVRSLHALTYLRGRDWHVAFPVVYAIGKPGQRHVGVVPFFATGRDYWTVSAALSGSWKDGSGGRTTWVTPLFHVSTDGDGAVRSLHALTYLRGRDWHVAFPVAYVVGKPGQRHVGVVPFFATGPDYWAVPAALSASWKNGSGGRTTWITPLFHRSSTADGRVASWHAVNVVHVGDTDLIVPLGWRTGSAGRRTTVILPVWFQGPDYLVVAPLYFRHGHGADATSGLLPLFISGRQGWVAPLALSARWTTNPGRTTTVVTPLFHRTTVGGQVLHQHLLTYVGTPEASTIFPLYWRWSTATGGTRRLVLPVYYQHDRADGGTTVAVLPPLYAWRRGHQLDTSWGHQLIPFSGQRTDDGAEINVLWHLLFHRRRQADTTEVMAGSLLWWSKRRAGGPMQWDILGGLIGRRRDPATGRMRTIACWVIPLSVAPPPKPAPAATIL